MGSEDTLALVRRAERHAARVAVVDGAGPHGYAALLDASARVAAALLDGRADLEEARVAYLVPPGFAHVAMQWGVWRAGGVAVPLALTHPVPELRYAIEDADVAAVVASPGHEGRAREAAAGRRVLLAPDALAAEPPRALPQVARTRRAMMLYTSGTTGKPKGVVTTHANLEAQVATLVDAWAWRPEDRVLHVLPLHHVHGIVNVLTCALWSGATCEMLPRFDADAVWARFTSGEVTLFMAVPTVYAKLLEAWEAAPPARREEMTRACGALRLMVCGSAALPVRTLERWREATGHTLLERYGMTEIGMALSNPLEGERRPGTVGVPLPGVEARLVDEAGAPVAPGTPGEVEVRGPSVFLEYWRRPDATAAAFRDGWFRTGDVAVVEDGHWRILGRASVDILKVGGYKVSALEVEETLRGHPDVAECAVVGLPDETYGQVVAAAVVARGDGAAPDAADLSAWLRDRLAPYKVPRVVALVDELPRNAMGKVTKPDVAARLARLRQA